MTNKNNKVIYTGMTNNLAKRVYEHKEKLVEGFTKKYNCYKLIWFEQHSSAYSAITREKQLKAGSRKKKIELIEVDNPEWIDLYTKLFN
ncbi:MAG: GIY-YIG nuclease family protein [Ignavibacteriae bacterium]|nr:GIY-YIG nuclease family protein [Ignavibacteriota bacterium]